MEKIIITIAAVILGMGGMAGGSAVDSNSIVQDGIEYYIQTDKAVYDLGEDVEMLFRVTNLRDEEVRIGCSRSPEFNLWVQKDGETIWMKVWGWYWSSPGVELLPAESEELAHSWDMKDDDGVLVEPGIYNVVGVMYNQPWNYANHGSPTITKVSVPIGIIREPATIYYVDADANGLNDGSSWANAYDFLQDALTDANSSPKPVEIRVAEGIYTPDSNLADPNGSGDRRATFQLINGVTLKGGYAGFGQQDPNARDIDAYETILSGDLNGNDGPSFTNYGENSYHVVTGSGIDGTAVLDGFTITGGNANGPLKSDDDGGGIWCYKASPTISNCVITKNSSTWLGGGMTNWSYSNPTVTNCLFSENEAGVSGGGMENYGHCSPMVKNCVFSQNSAGSGGGGMFNLASCSPTVINCVFSENKSTYSGGGMDNLGGSPTVTNCVFSENESESGNGGGMDNLGSSPTVTNCVFSKNKALSGDGGGMSNRGSSPTLTNSTFSGNSAEHGGGIYNFESSLTFSGCKLVGNRSEIGAGVYFNGGEGTVDNCVFIGNVAYAEDGGAMYNAGSSGLIVTNCTFAGNEADDFGASLYNAGGSPVLKNCILWNNAFDEICVAGGEPIVTYCDVQGGWPGEGNKAVDPCFVQLGYWDPNGTVYLNDDFWVDGDYHLLEDSPCIDAGDPNYVAEPNETDLDGRPRVIRGRIDMGAYEYRPTIPAEVRVVPRTLNLSSEGKWITAFLWLPEDYEVGDIDPNSVVLEDEIGAESCRVDTQEQVAMAKFSRSKVQSALGGLEPGDVELTVSGELSDGSRFEGTDTIRVIDKGKKK